MTCHTGLECLPPGQLLYYPPLRWWSVHQLFSKWPKSVEILHNNFTSEITRQTATKFSNIHQSWVRSSEIFPSIYETKLKLGKPHFCCWDDHLFNKIIDSTRQHSQENNVLQVSSLKIKTQTRSQVAVVKVHT